MQNPSKISIFFKLFISFHFQSCRDNEKIPIECLRPEVLEDELPQEEKQAHLLMQLIEQCWNEDPLCRPEFKTCMSDLGKGTLLV